MKLFTTLISGCLMAMSVLGSSAPTISDNPDNIIAIADFPAGGSNLVKGFVSFYLIKGLVNVHVDISGMPSSGGPFVYHIHENPVPDSNNCEATGLHLNPYNAPTNCDDQLDNSYCQVGDLSGKHGWFNSTCYETSYIDPYLSLDYNSKSSIIGKSLVFHFANLTKIACANIKVAHRLRIFELLLDYEQNNPEEYIKLNEALNSSKLDDDTNNSIDHLGKEISSERNLTKPTNNYNRHNHSNISGLTNSSNFTGLIGDSPDCESKASSDTFHMAVIIAGIIALLI